MENRDKDDEDIDFDEIDELIEMFFEEHQKRMERDLEKSNKKLDK